MHHIKDQRGAAIVNAFKGILTAKKTNKIWVDRGDEFYNNFSKDF